MSLSDVSKTAHKQTLLQKFNMTVESLTFEHVEKCSNVKELERIIKILRSGEEGSYPQLEKTAEEKLRKIAPNNHLLRIETSVLPTSALAPHERQQVSKDMQTWASEMSSRETLLKSDESVNTDEVPAVRNSSVPVPKVVTEKNKMNKSTSPKPKDKALRKCVPNDYTFWDKFDADSEVTKLDLEEERLAEKKMIERKQQEDRQLKMKQQMEEDRVSLERLKNSTGSGDGLSLPEKEFNALQEKNKGNEYFRSGDYLKAAGHYSQSIFSLPTVDAYNNRAQTYLKLKDFSSAIEDCNTVLALDPANCKAYYRRGCAQFFLEKFTDALDNFEKALEIDPNGKDIQDYVKKTRLKLGIPVSSKRVRVPIQTKVTPVEEVNNADDKYYPFFNTGPNDDIALNAFGTAKVMCRCSGTPGFMKKVNSLEDIKDHGQLCLRRNSRSQKREAKQSFSKTQGPSKSEPKPDCSEAHPELKNVKVKPIPSSSQLTPRSTPDIKDAISTLENLKSPYSFSVFWSSIRGLDDLHLVAKALRVLCPDQIAQVLGNKLDEKMLSLFILALKTHFSLSEEWGVIQRYLLSFTQLPRFSIVNMMLDKDTKKGLECLLNEAESLGLRVLDLLQLYGLTASA